MTVTTHAARLIKLSTLKPHPLNYRDHSDEAHRAHIRSSIEEHGFYRNVVTANDFTILAGHGVAEVSAELGVDKVPVVKLDIEPDSTQALKILAADNKISNGAVDDERALTELLKQISDDADLLGTGYDGQQLAALAMVTRTTSELNDFDAAAEWVGMPDYEAGVIPVAVNIQFDTDEDRLAFIDKMELVVSKRQGRTWSTWWPARQRNDVASLHWDADDE